MLLRAFAVAIAARPLHAILETADRQFVAVVQDALGDARAVDLDAVGAEEIADVEVILDLGHADVLPGDLGRRDLDVALLVPANQEYRLVDRQGLALAQGHQLRCHDDVIRTMAGPAPIVNPLPTTSKGHPGIPWCRTTGTAGTHGLVASTR